ncbi:MAG: M48 family metalloprotease [Phycisphaerae bacterium]|nr:M48 family metalloprotease [Phycisphaerae bacterium]
MPSSRRVEDVIRGEVAPARTSVGYMIAMFAAAVTLVLVVAAYVALIALVAYGTYWHAVNDLAWFAELRPGRTGSFRGNAFLLFLLVIVYVAPIVAGLITILFMLKPFLARPADEGWPVPLDPHAQRTFFSAVGRIAALLGAPTPSAIEIDADINASARLRSIVGRDLILRVGVPLFLTLSARDLLGVVAHELGHFRQGTGMRLSNVVSRANRWLLRAVYARDEWDTLLEEAAESESAWLTILANAARLAVWLSRRVLWVLAHIGLVVSASLLRQMEYDADRAQAAIAGTDSVASAFRSLESLGVGQFKALSRVAEDMRARNLPDNVPALVAAESRRAKPADIARMRRAMDAEKGITDGLFSSHPSEEARIAAVTALGPPYSPGGALHLDGPATQLLVGIEGLSKVVTIALFRERLGRRVENMTFQPTEAVTRKTAVDDELGTAIERYFGSPIHAQRAFPFKSAFVAPPTDLDRATATLASIASKQRTAGRSAKAAYDEFHAARGRVLAALRGQSLLTAGVRFKRSDLGFDPDPASARAALDRARTEEDFVVSRLDEFESLSAERLTAALALGLHPSIQRSLSNADSVRAMINRLPASLVALGDAHTALLAAHTTWCRMEAILEHGTRRTPTNQMREVVMSLSRALHGDLQRVKQALDEERDPFARGDMPPTIAALLIGPLPAAENVPAMAQALHHALDSVTEFRTRVLGRLVLAAEKVEKAALGATSAPREET